MSSSEGDGVGRSSLEGVFRTGEAGRGAYLSRLFAFFSEEVVRHWAADGRAPYRDLGRPTVWDEAGKYHTLDFTLERRSDGARFIGELKCEIQFENYKYMTLAGPDQVVHHDGGAAFERLTRMAREPRSHRVTINGKEQPVNGAILLWGVVTPEGRRSVMDHYGFADVLAIEDILIDLAAWKPAAWAEWVGRRRRWTDELFGWMAHPVEE